MSQILFKTPLDGYWQLLNLFWPESCSVMSVYGSKIQDFPQKICSENFIEYFTHSENGMAKCVSTQFLKKILRYSKIKKNVVQSK